MELPLFSHTRHLIYQFRIIVGEKGTASSNMTKKIHCIFKGTHNGRKLEQILYSRINLFKPLIQSLIMFNPVRFRMVGLGFMTFQDAGDER